MIIAILKEPAGERRVSLMPDQVDVLVKKEFPVLIENNCGDEAFAPNEMYTAKGATVASREEILHQADVILSIQLPSDNDIDSMKKEAVLLGVYQPLINHAFVQNAVNKGITVFSMDTIPRTTRAQVMDVLSSQANIAGYKAVVLAASLFPRYFPMFMTAAGSIPPARVLVLGAGVAGLQAIATARRLGAVVEVFDTRPAVKEEVLSLGGKFIEVEGAADASSAGGYAVEQTEEYKQKQQQRITDTAIKADIIITTAQIPGKQAPLLITQEALDKMKRGSVIIDLAASTGGNTAKTVNDSTENYKGITIVGNSNLASTLPSDASKLYGKNVLNFLQLILGKNGNIELNFEDDLVEGTCITFKGQITNERVKSLIVSK